MSRQIRFVQTVKDADCFFQFVNLHNASILVYYGIKGGIKPLANLDMLTELMHFQGYNIYISPRNYINNMSELELLEILCNGKAIAFSRTTINPMDKKGHSVGRIYIEPDVNTGVYLPEIIDLYGALSRYIKRYYHYDVTAKIYYGPDFQSLLSNQECYVWNGIIQHDQCGYIVPLS